MSAITLETNVFKIATEDMRVVAEAERIVGNAVSHEDTPGFPVRFVDVTLRDGLQQDDIKKGNVLPNGKPEGLTIDERLAIVDCLVEAGIEEFEAAHAGNPEDRPFLYAWAKHRAQKIVAGDERYARTRTQVLFGAQPEAIREGIHSLDGIDKDSITVHVYNRISPGLRGLASVQPNTPEQSSDDLCGAIDIALAAGFRHFSVSGEGAVDHTQGPEVVADYHNRITRYLFENGAESVNINLANTFGSSAHGLWDEEGLRDFNASVKAVAQEFPGKAVTTSIHAHNDYGSAVDYSITAVRAGFDKIEGAMIGMGERVGNTAIADVLVRLAEMATIDYENIERFVRSGKVPEDIFTTRALRRSVFAHRYVSPHMVASFGHVYHVAEQIGAIAETPRFDETSLGKTRSYDAGSGPHCEANAKYVQSPLQHRLLEVYGRIANIHAMFGHPEAQAIVEVETERMKAITVNNHAGGGNTRKVHEGRITRAPQEEIDAHIAIVEARHAVIKAYMAKEPQFVKAG